MGGDDPAGILPLKDEEDGGLPTILSRQIPEVPDVAGPSLRDRIGEEAGTVLHQGHGLHLQHHLTPIRVGEEEVEARVPHGSLSPDQVPLSHLGHGGTASRDQLRAAGVVLGPELQVPVAQEVLVVEAQFFQAGAATLVSLISIFFDVPLALLPSAMF